MSINSEIDTQEDVELIYCGKAKCEGSTGLRCYKTGVPICSKCSVYVKGVGYMSEDVAKEQEKKFYNASMIDHLIAGATGFFGLFVLGILFGITLGQIGFISFFISFFLGPAAGGMIGEMIWRSIKQRRGKNMARTVGISMGLAALLAAGLVFSLSTLLFGGLATSAAVARFQVGIRM